MDNAHYSYNFGFFSCPKSQVESFLIINIFFIVNNTEFLQEENKKATVNVQTCITFYWLQKLHRNIVLGPLHCITTLNLVTLHPTLGKTAGQHGSVFNLA